LIRTVLPKVTSIFRAEVSSTARWAIYILSSLKIFLNITSYSFIGTDKAQFTSNKALLVLKFLLLIRFDTIIYGRLKRAMCSFQGGSTHRADDRDCQRTSHVEAPCQQDTKFRDVLWVPMAHRHRETRTFG